MSSGRTEKEKAAARAEQRRYVEGYIFAHIMQACVGSLGEAAMFRHQQEAMAAAEAALNHAIADGMSRFLEAVRDKTRCRACGRRLPRGRKKN